MARVIKVGGISKEPEREYPCPRDCGNLSNKRKIGNLKKHYKCKKCGGINLSINEMESLFRLRGIKKNKLERFLNSGKPGGLNCPTCSRKMQVVELRYDKKAVDAGQKPGAGSVAVQTVLQPQAAIIALPLLAIYGLSQLLLGPKQQTHDLKTVTIDSCGSCNSFWFDKNELQELAQVGQFAEGAVQQLYSKESGHVEVAKHGSEVTPGVSTVSVAEKGTQPSPGVKTKKK
jgi:Zn-finger nucleic acid-binding protein